MSEPAVETQALDECRACGYVYEPEKDSKHQVSPGTPFTELPSSWRCPVCGVKTSQFSNIGPVGKASDLQKILDMVSVLIS